MAHSRTTQTHARIRESRGCASQISFAVVVILLVIGIVLVLATQGVFSDDARDKLADNLGGDPIRITPTAPPTYTPDPLLPTPVPTLLPGMIAGQTHTRLQGQSDKFLADVCSILAAQPAGYDVPAAGPIHAACAHRDDPAPNDATRFTTWTPALCEFPSLLDALNQRAPPLPHLLAFMTTLCAERDAAP